LRTKTTAKRKQEKSGRGYQGIRNNNLTEIHRKIRRKEREKTGVRFVCLQKEDEIKKGKRGYSGEVGGDGDITITRSKVADRRRAKRKKATLKRDAVDRGIVTSRSRVVVVSRGRFHQIMKH
jgi:hypothetical protein